MMRGLLMGPGNLSDRITIDWLEDTDLISGYLRLLADLGHKWTVLEVTGQTPGHLRAQADLHLMKKNIESWNVPGLYFTFVLLWRTVCQVQFQSTFPRELGFGLRRTAPNMPKCNLYGFYAMLCPHSLTSFYPVFGALCTRNAPVFLSLLTTKILGR